MRLVRVIQKFSKKEEVLYKEYKLEITSTQLLEDLSDLILNEDDYEDEIYDQYNLIESQVQKLKPFLKELLKADFEKYTYELGCYEEEESLKCTYHLSWHLFCKVYDSVLSNIRLW